MKQMKKLSALAAGSMAIGLLFGTSTVQAEEVCYDNDNDTVLGIKGLDVFTEQFGDNEMDVDFRYTTGFEIYGSNLQNLPFGQAFGEDDAASVRASINNALNAESSVPDFAGRPDQIEYYIGVEEEQGAGLGAVAAWAAANYTGDEWAPCEKELTEDCLAGSRILPAADLFTYAHLTKAVTGASCDGAPPPEEEPPTTSYTITPCITGSWYLDARDGGGTTSRSSEVNLTRRCWRTSTHTTTTETKCGSPDSGPLTATLPSYPRRYFRVRSTETSTTRTISTARIGERLPLRLPPRTQASLSGTRSILARPRTILIDSPLS
jgi:hypothetical protein